MNTLKNDFKNISLFLFFIMMNGCVSARDGETFVIGVDNKLCNPSLEYAMLISDDKKIWIEETNSYKIFDVSNGVIIPVEIEVLWRAFGEKIPHSEIIKLREKIPNDVLKKIKGDFSTHYLSLEFFVLENKPHFRWYLTETLPGQTSDFKEVSRGGHWRPGEK
jgi:hypothetical protein